MRATAPRPNSWLRGRTAASSSVLALCVVLSGAPAAWAQPGPGDPFGGDVAGCVPVTKDHRSCAEQAAKAVEKLRNAIVRCHAAQAADRFDEVVGGGTGGFDEEACEAAADAKLDAKLAKLASRCEGSATLAGVAAHLSVLRNGGSDPDSLDALGGALYCDSTSGVPIDPGGDDAGTVPSSAAHLECGERAGKNLVKLAKDVAKCHRDMGRRGFVAANPPFDEDACEAAALAKYDAAAASLAASGACPSCLDAGAQEALGDASVVRLDAANGSFYPCPDPVLDAGTPVLDRPTLVALGVRVPVTGDVDRDASVAVRYRASGDLVWRDALPLLRVRPEDVDGRAVAEEFAGSIFDLRPATTYEIELHAVDADGPVDETVVIAGTTRSVPADPATPNVRPVSTAAALASALATAAPGDVISLADGVYAGPFVLDASGTAANPIVIRGASTAGTILDGGDCDDCNVVEVYGSYVHVERLRLRSAQRALRFQTANATANVVRRVRMEDVRLGLGSRDGQTDFYVCDNELAGRLVWPHNYFDDGGAHSDDDGILVNGDGHVVCHNDIVGFGDAIKNGAEGSRAMDVYGNEVRSAYDNGVELDAGEGNLRALRNRFTNNFVPLSFQPVYGGPAYAIRNVAVNVVHEQLKFHGVGGDSGPSGVLVYHNTFVCPESALIVATSAASRHFALENNLFVTRAALAGTRIVDWTGPIEDGRFESDGYFPSGSFRLNLVPAGLTSFADLSALQAAGLETQGRILAEPIFANGLAAPATYTVTLAPQDVTLAAASNAVDAAGILPNVNDGATGSGPDLGALERGCPLPIYGVRTPGTDESNEPFGCAP